MTRVWIAQCLCPSRHCIVANAGEAEDAADAKAKIERPLRATLARMIESGAINPWCALCGAALELWRYETARTRFATMAEAQPELDRNAAEQAVTNALFGDMPGRPN